MTNMNLPIPDAALSQHLIALGKTGSGKSSALRVLVEGMLNADRRVCIIDPKGDWWGLKLSASGKSAGFPVVIFGGEHADVPINEHAGAQIAELVGTGNRPCIIDLGGWGVGERTRFFIDYAAALFRTNKNPLWQVIDEVHNFAPESKGGQVSDPQRGMMLHWANRLASEGRGKNVVLMAASQRPQKTAKDFVTSMETLIAMRVIHPLDRNAMKDWIDGCPNREKGKEVLDSLASMKRSEAWVWSPEIGFGPNHIKFPMFKTYDSFSPHTGEGSSRLRGWAEVDLDEVKSKLAAVVEEAKANDPKELKRQLADLQRQLAAKPPAATAKVERVEIQVVDEPMMKRVEKTMTRLEVEGQGLREKADQLLQEGRDLRAAMARAAHKSAAPIAAPRIAPAPRKQVAVSGPGESLPKVERLILTALAQYPEGRTKVQIAVLAGYAVTGGGFNNGMGALRSKQYIYDSSGELVCATDAGLAALGSYEPLPSGAALLDHWRRQLGKAEREIMDVLAESYPNRLTKEQIGAATPTGYEPSGGGFNNAIGRLRTLELIEGRGEIKASDNLFDGATA